MSSFREATLHTPDDAQLAYRVRPGRDPWVLLHALACDSSLWDDVVAALPHDIGLVIPELRGHGGSTLGWAIPSIDLFASDVLAIVEAEGLESPAIAGLSMGGYVALAIAAARPDAARAWAFLSTQARPDDEAGRAARAEALGLIDRQGCAAWVESVLPRWVASTARHGHVRGMAARAGDAGLTVAILALANRPDRRALLPSLGQPVLAVAGDRDAITPPERLQEIAGGVAAGRLLVFPGASHLVALDAPEAVANALASLEKTSD